METVSPISYQVMSSLADGDFSELEKPAQTMSNNEILKHAFGLVALSVRRDLPVPVTAVVACGPPVLAQDVEDRVAAMPWPSPTSRPRPSFSMSF